MFKKLEKHLKKFGIGLIVENTSMFERPVACCYLPGEKAIEIFIHPGKQVFIKDMLIRASHEIGHHKDHIRMDEGEKRLFEMGPEYCYMIGNELFIQRKELEAWELAEEEYRQLLKEYELEDEGKEEFNKVKEHCLLGYGVIK